MNTSFFCIVTLSYFLIPHALEGKPAIFTTKNGTYSVALSDKTVACSGAVLNTLVNADTRENPTIALDALETKEELDLFAQQIHTVAALSAHAGAVHQENPDKTIIKQLTPTLQQLRLPTLTRLLRHADFYGVPHVLPALEQELLGKIVQWRVPLTAQLAEHDNQSLQLEGADQERAPLVAQRATHREPLWLANLPERMSNKELAHKIMQRHQALFFAAQAPQCLSETQNSWSYYNTQFSSDGGTIVNIHGALYNAIIQIWERTKSNEWVAVRTPSQGSTSFDRVRLSPNGSKIVAIASSKNAYVWEKDTRNQWASVTLLEGHTERIYGAEFSPDNATIVTYSRDCTARVWQRAADNQWVTVATLTGHTKEVVDTQFSPDGSKIVTVSGDSIIVWQKNEAGQWLAIARQNQNEQGNVNYSFREAHFSPDGTKILLRHLNASTTQVWECYQEAPLTTLQGHTRPIECAQFSPDGTKIITASADTTAHIWEQNEPGQWVSTALLQGHTGWIVNVQFSPDSTKIATSSFDGTARVWQKNEAGEWVTIATKQGLGKYVKNAQFSPDGNKILIASGAGGSGGSLCIWDLVDVVHYNKQAGLVLKLQDVLPALQQLDPATQSIWSKMVSLVTNAEKEKILRGLIATIKKND